MKVYITCSAVVVLLASVAIARSLGPEKLGRFVYVVWLTQIGALLGNLGIPVTLRMRYSAKRK